MSKFFRTAAAVALTLSVISCGQGAPAQTEAGEAADPLASLVIEKVYDDDADSGAQIDSALAAASESGRFVIAQVGGNWCKWCLRFAAFVKADQDLSTLVDDNFVYIHVNNQKADPATGKRVNDTETLARLGNPGRFGYPVFVVLDAEGHVLHIQDSSFLEEGELYDKSKVTRFFKNWTPDAVNHK